MFSCAQEGKLSVDRLFGPLRLQHTVFPALAVNTLPEPFSHGCLYGSASVAMMSSPPYSPDVQAAARAGTLLPKDYTDLNGSFTEGAGAVISTASDLATWIEVLVSGRVLNANISAAEPMRCRAVTALPEDGRWRFEIKFDGYRCIAVKRGSEVTLFSRNRNVLNDRFPNVADALRIMEGDFVLDGEIVALDEQGRPSFQLLQNGRTRPLSAYYYLFDLLIRDGEALHTQTIERRRERLSELFPESIDRLTQYVCRRCCRLPSTKFLREYENFDWRALSGSATVLNTKESCSSRA